MEVQAIAKFVRIAPEKANQIARLLAGKAVNEALALVDLSPRKAARLLGRTLRSALANAENNLEIDRARLVVKTAHIAPGPMLRRYRPKARGMAGRIRKRTSHFTVVLSDEI